jgi:hypothetical protein
VKNQILFDCFLSYGLGFPHSTKGTCVLSSFPIDPGLEYAGIEEVLDDVLKDAEQITLKNMGQSKHS